jgi:hypothetical protein
MLIAALTSFTTSPELSPLAFRRFASSMNAKLGTWTSTLPARISLLRSLLLKIPLRSAGIYHDLHALDSLMSSLDGLPSLAFLEISSMTFRAHSTSFFLTSSSIAFLMSSLKFIPYLLAFSGRLLWKRLNKSLELLYGLLEYMPR